MLAGSGVKAMPGLVSAPNSGSLYKIRKIHVAKWGTPKKNSRPLGKRKILECAMNHCKNIENKFYRIGPRLHFHFFFHYTTREEISLLSNFHLSAFNVEKNLRTKNCFKNHDKKNLDFFSNLTRFYFALQNPLNLHC